MPKGLDLNLHLTLGDNRVLERSQFHARTASYNILKDLVVYTKDKATTLQRTLDDIRVNLYQQFDCNTATSKWNLAKKSTHGLTRELRLRYRNKIKGIIPVNPPRNETIAETTVKQKRPNRRFSKKTRNPELQPLTLELKKKVNNFIPSTFPKKFLPMMRRAF
jgi:hypothetical protein